jgi:hypothetical protein
MRVVACNFCGSDQYEERRIEYLYSHQGKYLLVPNTPVETAATAARAIKPDVLAPGGRTVVQEYLGSTTHAALDTYNHMLPPGQTVAAPGPTPGDRNAMWCTRGTSNATALVSHAAALLYDVLDELRADAGGETIDTVPRSIWLKALLAHGANWGTAGPVFEGILRTVENSRQFKEYVTRLLGYGVVDVERVRECTAYRATAISGGVLTKDQSHIHRFPLPQSLSGQHGRRRLTATLAWMTPVNPRHQSWRRADLWFAPPKEPIRVDRQQADWRAVQRGTLQHEILEGEGAAVFVDGDNLEIHVSCRADAGELDEEVPYALVMTLEVAEEVGGYDLRRGASPHTGSNPHSTGNLNTFVARCYRLANTRPLLR